MARTLMQARGYPWGCPRPAPAPAPEPPPPSPSAPDEATFNFTGTGIVWNGFGKYAGFVVNSHAGAGTITIHGGPNNTFPIIHQVTSYTLGTWEYAPGVDEADEDTYIESSSVYAVCGGTTQALTYAIHDPLEDE